VVPQLKKWMVGDVATEGWVQIPAAPPMLTLKSTNFSPLFYRLILNRSNFPFNNQLRQTFSTVWIACFGVAAVLSQPQMAKSRLIV